MNVEAGVQPLGSFRAGLQRLIGEGERGVEAERGGELRVRLAQAALEEAHVLADPRGGAGHAVAIGHLVAQAGTQPGLFHRIGDEVEAAVDDVGAGVVVDQRRAAVPDRVHQADERAGADVIPQQRPIQLPPEPLQDLDEIGRRRAGDRHAAGECAVEVRVPADRARQDELARSVQPLGSRIFRG